MLVFIIIRLLIWLLLSLCFRVLLIYLTLAEMWRWHCRERRRPALMVGAAGSVEMDWSR
jgi:hypothetical protein